MSQETMLSRTTQSDEWLPVPEEMDDVGYRPVPILAPISLLLGLCSIIGLAAPAGLAVCLVGMVLGALCVRKIRGSRGEYGGATVGTLGLILSTGFLLCGSALHAYSYATEVPEGYTRLNFGWLGKQNPIVEDGEMRIAPEAQAFDGQKVYVKGYMYPTGQQTGLSRVVLCKDTGQCCFGGQPKLTDMIVVEFQNGMTVNHREQQLVGVGGTFRARKVIVGGQLVSLYSLEGDYFR
jgi:hypothetical protein